MVSGRSYQRINMLLKERAHLVSHITLPSFMQKLEGSTVFSYLKKLPGSISLGSSAL